MSDPVINVAYDFTVSLVSQVNNNVFQTNPTIAAGDFQISIADGALANLATLPVVAPAGSDLVVISLSAAEMNGKKIVVLGKDQAGNEWADIMAQLQPNVRGADDLAFPTVADRSIDVSTTGGVGLDWSNVENQASTINLSDTTINLVNTATTAAGTSSAATAFNLAVVDANVDAILLDTSVTLPDQITALNDFDPATETVDVDRISGNSTAATNLSSSALGIEPASAIAGTLSTTQMTTDLTETTDDHYKGRIIVWTSGSLANQATDITAYTGSTKLLTYTATTEAPAASDTFVIV